MSDAAFFEASLAALRPRLLGFARLQLRNASLAEDVVQDTLLAAFEGRHNFAGASAFQTWVFSIARHKIIDAIRSSARQIDLVSDDSDEDADAWFDKHEHWVELPTAWHDPERSLEQQRFWEVLDACLTILPASPARVFMMREFLGLETTEICTELSISSSNCWVLLHRARLGLRECLSLRWFGESP